MTKFWRASLRIFALAFLVGLIFDAATRAQPQDPGQDQGTIRLNVNLVLMDATVKTKDGQIMTNLKKEDFEVREDGIAQKLDVFSRDEMPLKVALAALKPDDEVALFTFATEAEMRLPLTKDKNKIADQIATFDARGATNIN